ncbi:MAG: hypothetical protein EBZ77_12305, partial [Chitinophagia bacterium]|nr:hypothetical protein [Chitinophagia bacterium]
VGATSTYTDSVTGGRWSSSLTAVATVDSVTGTVTAVSAGSTMLTYRLTTACGSSTISRSINVNSPASAGTISGRTPFCVGSLDTFTVTGATGGGTWSSGTVSVASVTDAANGYFIGTGIGAATISYSVSTPGCAPSVSTYNPIVQTLPSAGTITGASTICASAPTSYTPSVSGGSWSISPTGTATVSSSGVVTGLSAGVANLTYTVTNLCGSDFTVLPITVSAPPTVAPIGGADSVCEGGATTLYTSAPSGGTWTTDASTVASVDGSGLVTGVLAGNANISYTVTNSCGSTTVHKNVVVKALPSAGTLSGTSVICTGSSASLTPSVTGGAWSTASSGIASVNSSGLVTGVATGSTTISYTVTNSCSSAVATYAVSIIATPVAGGITGSSTACTGVALAYAYTGTPGGVWSTSNATVASVDGSGNIAPLTAGTATITYILATTCRTDTAVKTLTVSATPDAGTITGAPGICVGATTTLTTTGTVGSWSTATGTVASIDASGMVYGVAPGSETIYYTVTSASCGTAVATYSVSVANLPSAGTVGGTGTVCEGSTVSLTTTGTGGIWTTSAVSIASVEATGTVTGVGAGTAHISYVVTNACGADSAGMAVVVNPLPNAGGISGPSSVCPGSTVNLTHTGTAGSWSSGSSSIASVSGSATTGTVYGITAGSATISYTVTNSCGT